jgi:hypothetical protein
MNNGWGGFFGTLTAVAMMAASIPAAADESAADGARYTDDGQLIKPENYRQWVLIGTGLGMAYGPLRQTANSKPPFTNVFVNPSAYRAFLQTGAWPDKTVFILEGRASVPVNNSESGANGYFQGEILGIEAEVKDESRFPGKWAFFAMNASRPTGAKIPDSASCYSCHAKNAAVDNTFVQFYPVLRDVAKDKGTMKPVPESF